ncbi:MAG: stage III sporulation protein AE [Lachnospiraceae bacterium]|nr:stage III sporulation protein AE [Lachnospiraceae bacterium]
MASTDVIWQQYELERLEEGMRSIFPGTGFHLNDLLAAVWSGDIIGAGKLLLHSMGDMSMQLTGVKNVLVWLLVLGILSALMTHFVEVFDRNQVADLSFYFCYLMIVAILLKGFYQIAQVAEEALDNILLFHRLLIPTYLIAVGVATGTTTVNAYSQLLLFIMYGVEQILMKWVIPMIYSYCMLAVINGIWKEEKLALLMELIHKCVGWILKAAIGLVTGVSVFQSVITPVIDAVKTSALQKVITMIPGAGNLADGVLELLAGSAMMIKNSVGVVLLLLLLALCAAPLIKIFVMGLLFKVTAAVLELISDKRITSCVDKIGDAGILLLRTVGCVMMLFLIALAVVAASGGKMGV